LHPSSRWMRIHKKVSSRSCLRLMLVIYNMLMKDRLSMTVMSSLVLKL